MVIFASLRRWLCSHPLTVPQTERPLLSDLGQASQPLGLSACCVKSIGVPPASDRVDSPLVV